MSLSRARLTRARKTQRILAEAWYRLHGWTSAEAVYGANGGRDITGMPGLAPEVKATSGEPLLAALRQARKNAAGDLPYVVWRPDGYGPERLGEWVVAMTLEDHTNLLHAAGYGDRIDGEVAS